MRTIHRIARKAHVCEACSENIAPGEKYELIETRWPEYDKSDCQIGIEFFRMKFHHINGVSCGSECEYSPNMTPEENEAYHSQPFGDNNI